MALFTKNRLAAWAIVILVLLNVVALGTLWWTQIRRPGHPPPPPDRRPRHDVSKFLEQELELTTGQAEQLRVLRETNAEQSYIIEQEIHKYRLAMAKAMFEKDPNIKQVETWANRIGQKHEELELKRFQHFIDMKSLCTQEQALRFEALLRKVLETTRPPGPPPPDKDRRLPKKQPPPPQPPQPF